MLRIRKLVLAIAAASALSSGMAHALGLGELTLKSAQNQPLNAEIELLDVRDLSPADLKPSLAPAEEFAKAGVERPPFLNDLTFTPVINPAGKSVLKVTSSQALPEPMVKFLVQVMWPQGRLLRDYSVLLDASKFSPETAQAASGVTPAATAPTNYTTVRRDTLWEIASRSRQGGSVQQTMLAIQALNPDAFINGNINQLKTGQVLRMPDQQQIQSVPQAQAVKEVNEQYAAWRQGRRLGPQARQLDATRRDAAQAAPARIAEQDNLKLVAPGGKGQGSDKALSDKLAMTQENLDSSRREGDELKSRVADLQSQLDKLQRLIELKNDQLARLEAQSNAPAAPVASAPVIDAQLQANPAPAAEPVVPAPAAVDTEPQQVTPPAAPESAAAPAVEEGENKGLDGILGNPQMLALIAGSALLALLLLILLLVRKRKAQQEAEKHMRMARALAEESELGPDLDLPPSSFDGLDMAPPTVKLAPAVVAASAAAATAAEQVSEPRAAEPKIDPFMAEIDDCIAHGRLMQASNLLEPAVEKFPQRSDLRLKLMEVYARQGDRDGFVSQERQLQANPHNLAEVDSLKSRFPTMVALAAAAAGAAVASGLDEKFVEELMSDEPQAQADADLPADDELDSAFDLSLDDLDGLELEAPADQAAVEASSQAPAEPSLDDLDFDTLLQDNPEAPQAEPPQLEPEPAGLADDLDFDSLLQEHTAAQAAEPAPQVEPEPPVVDDLDFDSLLEEHTAAQASEPQAPVEPAAVDDDLDFDSLLEEHTAAQASEPQAPVEPAAVDDDLDFDSLLQEHTAAQASEPQAPVEPAAVEDDLDFDSLLQEHTAAQAQPEPEPELSALDDDLDFDALLDEHTKVQSTATDDLADFDLSVPDEAPSVTTENRPPLDIEAELAAFDNDLGLEADLPDLELPDDFDLSLPGEDDAASKHFAAELDNVNAELDKLSASLETPSLEPHFTAEDAASLAPEDEEFDYLSGTDEVATKLDLARAYIDMGDHDGARDILDEVYKEGDQDQRREANELRSKLS
ncbi:FimV/HubP family polar landmark protein [Pseudomonas japonica]|uniref:Pilus assembly protein FimV n=1 Tax=Pseudomonas japonica TaxID=256466 RepID=A0A239GF07_9PSED|nr:FimV/HubP family polar landmark protein [Pseudomonas japonica]SNS67485.1 pilus assembly protein FimV [Pseudomonas japonica]